VSVYVDKAKNKFGRMIMCHMMADTVKELHQMAGKLGLKREWFQSESTPHYDICKSNREKAIKLGAVIADRKKVVELIRVYRSNK